MVGGAAGGRGPPRACCCPRDWRAGRQRAPAAPPPPPPAARRRPPRPGRARAPAGTQVSTGRGRGGGVGPGGGGAARLCLRRHSRSGKGGGVGYEGIARLGRGEPARRGPAVPVRCRPGGVAPAETERKVLSHHRAGTWGRRPARAARHRARRHVAGGGAGLPRSPPPEESYRESGPRCTRSVPRLDPRTPLKIERAQPVVVTAGGWKYRAVPRLEAGCASRPTATRSAAGIRDPQRPPRVSRRCAGRLGVLVRW